ncbi:hypothetical protein [Lysinibacillus piscis]|uniref:Uncharacterized protein n=1 Tax=Lysinibacillus piscis TaxID=2518931 RepID=A0ABQ5NGH7_9BACI|nr:hypothetical protein [Lysinibacillus sp. KH24]GLC87477.1 hypothetical protein LYSBPC_06040 [Lysinibacillus sp. KH24]
MSILENIPSSLPPYIVTILPLVAYVVKLTIDNWGITDLERIRLSNFKRFQIALTKYIMLSISFVATMFLIITISGRFTELKGGLLFSVLAACCIIFVALIFLFEKFIYYIVSWLSFKYDYHIVNDNGDSIYRIIKLSNDNSLLVESNGIEEFLDSKEKRKYKRIRRKDTFHYKIYNSSWILGCTVITGVVSVGMLISVFLNNNLTQFILYVLFLLTLLVTLILSLNYNDNRKYRTENNNQQNPR